MFEKRNVLVTGGAGFVGANLVERLLAIGARVTATLYRRDPIIQDERIRYVRCDLENKADCRRVMAGQDYVFMCAANSSGAFVMETTPLVHLTPNIIMNLRVLDAAHEAGVKKFLFISGTTIYPVTDHPVKEGDVTNEFFEKYFIEAWMKRFSEIVCEMYGQKIQRPMETIIVRPTNLFGEYDDFNLETSHVIPALIRKVVERHDPVEVWGSGQDIKDFIYVEDFISGLLMAMEKLSTFDIVNIASGQPIRICDTLDVILKIDGYESARVVYNPSKPSMIPKRLVDPSRAWERMGFKPQIALAEGIERTVRWYRRIHDQQKIAHLTPFT